MGLLGKKYKNSEEIFADVAYHENRNFVAAPVLGLISLFRDIKVLKE